ncbi:helix-turn-helix domain-containing protein [Bdellovibrio bacteriovorus]|uniref:HTH cro/C1-type domain-containing protein n=1 Tax=Bdellovibrio bacteriovorus TaxID=959 RepID=A0A1Z3N6D7_BDEBC|nr:helix-turn-helix domain-containing protein [Bdellovibrio bacteriovorus]ASD63028.1 hypothetical protein B9G79_05315 [Bdellovibrio bacteriovorus]
MNEFTGGDLRAFRTELRLSRAQLAALLNVSPTTVEKWEQRESEPIRSKYHTLLSSLGAKGVGVAIGAGIAGVVAAPAVLGFAAALGATALATGSGASFLKEDSDTQSLRNFLVKFGGLSEEEKRTFIDVLQKMI